jgi:hypothetical protein
MYARPQLESVEDASCSRCGGDLFDLSLLRLDNKFRFNRDHSVHPIPGVLLNPTRGSICSLALKGKRLRSDSILFSTARGFACLRFEVSTPARGLQGAGLT